MFVAWLRNKAADPQNGPRKAARATKSMVGILNFIGTNIRASADLR
jgi:hypothetical protein